MSAPPPPTLAERLETMQIELHIFRAMQPSQGSLHEMAGRWQSVAEDVAAALTQAEAERETLRAERDEARQREAQQLQSHLATIAWWENEHRTAERRLAEAQAALDKLTKERDQLQAALQGMTWMI